VSNRLIGAPLTRREDARILRGETRYVDDIERPGMGHAAFVRSPFASATIDSISVPDCAEGMIAVLTGAELSGLRRFPVMQPAGAEVADSEAHPLLAIDEVRYAGQPVAAVIARTRALAEDACELIEVQYDERLPVLSARESDRVMMSWARLTGDVDGAFASAAQVVCGSYALPRLIAAPIETRGAVAEYSADDDVLSVWCSAQDVHRPLAQLSHILGRSPESIHLVVPDVGGAFGSKGVIAPEAAVVAEAAIRLGIPVKWTEDRLENMVACAHGRGIEGDVELALDADGRMLGLRARIWADLGGYLLTTSTVPPHTTGTLITGCYDIAAADVRVVGARTNKAPTGPYRGAGRPDAAYMVEALVDKAARQTGIDRVELRRRNLIRSFPCRTATGLEYDSGDFERCLDLALELADRDSPRAGRTQRSGEAAATRTGRTQRSGEAAATRTGSGLAVYVERAGGGLESAEIELLPGGRFRVESSSSPHGQGHDITFAQIAADRLEVEPGAVELGFGDSAVSPPGTGTFGSRSVAQAGSAVALAADKLVELARGAAAWLLDTDRESVALRAGGFAGPDDRGWVGWARLAEAGEQPLRAASQFESANVFSSGAYAARVEIDAATGRLTVRRLVAVDDAGTLINPLLVHGQVLGGAVQALGECLVEEAVYDDDGQMRSGSFLDYSLLTAAEIPSIATGEVQTPSPLNPLGAKGAGEGGAIGTLAAVANAVVDALGGRHVDPPFTAEKLWRALREAGA
jgi:aerobic carbon-monoxide dehydrogenase large subunit